MPSPRAGVATPAVGPTQPPAEPALPPVGPTQPPAEQAVPLAQTALAQTVMPLAGALEGGRGGPPAPGAASGLAARPAGRRWRGWRWVPWVAAVVAAGAALALGASTNSRPPSIYERTLQVAGQYRCPVCAGESAAASDAPEAVQIRKAVQHWLAEGKTPAQIRSYLVADYGPSILERPPASGLDAVVWLAPLVVLAVGGLGLALALARWRRAGEAPRSGDRRRPGPRAVARWARRLERLLSGRAAQRLTLTAGIALMVLAGALWVVDRSAGPRLPSGAPSGGAGNLQAELQRASSMATKDPARALQLYDEVLARDPGQPVALASEGWIYVQAGFVGKGMGLLAAAEAADPSYDLPHLYQGLALLGEAHRGAAARQLRWYLAHGPDPSLLAVARAALARASS